MRALSPTLLAAQQSASTVPCLQLKAVNRRDGVVRLDFSRLYNGYEPEYFHAAAVPADGSLLRVRITPPEDGRKLYYQRVENPSAASDFSQWVYANQYNTVITAAASLDAEISIFWIKADRRIERIRSLNCGLSWSAVEFIDYTPTTAINGLAAAYKPGGDLALFFTDQQTLYVKKHSGGQWQPRTVWDKTTGVLSGLAASYDGDWNLFITGQDTGGNFKLWSLIYGDGGSIPAGGWSGLAVIATAPSAGLYEYRHAFLAKPDVFRCFYVERFSGQESYSRPFGTHTVSGTDFADNLWRESLPFDAASGYGLAVTHCGSYCWLSSASGVWRASLEEKEHDLSRDVISIRQDISPYAGNLAVELSNDDGTLPLPLNIGCEIIFSPGYLTAQGEEVSPGQSFQLESYEFRSAGGLAGLVLRATGGWERLHCWQARQQFRWNMAGAEKSVREILALVLARAGIKLEVISSSQVISSFHPDFSISPGDRGDGAVRHLLETVPDVIFMEGHKAYLLNPRPDDESVYGYGESHIIFEAASGCEVLPYNRVQVDNSSSILVDSFDWAETGRYGDYLLRVEDSNITSIAQAQERGNTLLYKAKIYSASGFLVVPPNCGQQLYDVIDITDTKVGFSNTGRRVTGWRLSYKPVRGEYRQTLALGEV